MALNGDLSEIRLSGEESLSALTDVKKKDSLRYKMVIRCTPRMLGYNGCWVLWTIIVGMLTRGLFVVH